MPCNALAGSRPTESVEPHLAKPSRKTAITIRPASAAGSTPVDGASRRQARDREAAVSRARDAVHHVAPRPRIRDRRQAPRPRWNCWRNAAGGTDREKGGTGRASVPWRGDGRSRSYQQTAAYLTCPHRGFALALVPELAARRRQARAGCTRTKLLSPCRVKSACPRHLLALLRTKPVKKRARFTIRAGRTSSSAQARHPP